MFVAGAFRLGVIALLGAFAAFLVLPDEAAAQNFPGGSWRQSCRDARMEGRDTLRAECQRRNGSWNRTGIDIDKCGRGGTVANMDGNLVCESHGGVQGGNQNLPGGSWRQSCRNATLNGRDDLRADCQRRNGSWNRTSIDIDKCGRGGTLANIDGNLVCEGQVGGGHGGGWWGQGLPPGSYQRTCRNARIEGRDLLTAQCQRQNGNWRSTRLDIDECRGRDIANDNGHLECGGKTYGGSYGQYQLPPGSWSQSCRNARVIRDDLYAECRQRDGDWVRSSLDLDDCRGRSVSNDNGRLVCASFGGSRPLPPGSWQQTCRNPRFEGGRFVADCRERNGGWNTDGIDLRDCQGRPLRNEDGKLRC